jgi:hypothetical protein
VSGSAKHLIDRNWHNGLFEISQAEALALFVRYFVVSDSSIAKINRINAFVLKGIAEMLHACCCDHLLAIICLQQY